MGEPPAMADGDDPVVVTGFEATRARKLTPGEKEANRVLAAGRAPVKRDFVIAALPPSFNSAH
ncbi:hypothetical protein [Streptomyces fodineus]|uniref:hypothetical protein n=1 Tax=Streptomyces fodineus TaxID=1904616 RepID=UPI001873B3B3|nr:hypothetical protein [Streptomyces fodineus]